MVFNKAQFYTELYNEHLMEAGILIASIQSYFFDAEISWLDVRQLMLRVDAHVGAIELGQNVACHCAIEYLTSHDEDELLGAAYALATINPNDEKGLDAVLDAYAKEQDEARLGHFITAFKHGQHPRLGEKLQVFLSHDRALIRAATIEILGYRREGDPRRAWPLLHEKNPLVQRAAILALARFGYRGALPAAEQIVLDAGDTINEDYLLVLLMLGSKRALDVCRRACQSSEMVTPKLLLYLAIAGTYQDFNIVLSAKQYSHVIDGVIQALGLFGLVPAVSHLLAALKLDRDDLRAEAGVALEMITGAGLRETQQVPEKEPEETKISDILGGTTEDDEAQAEETPKAAPRMIDTERPCAVYDIWNEWWQNNAARFDPKIRWRKGQPFDLGACITEIAAPNSHYHDRERAYLELVIRSGQHIGFEPDWFIPRQLKSIHDWQCWWDARR